MQSNYVLIDYENVHPKNLELLVEHPFQVFVFVGQNQAKIPFDLADSLNKVNANLKELLSKSVEQKLGKEMCDLFCNALT